MRSPQMRGLFTRRSPQSHVRSRRQVACAKDGALIVCATPSDRWRRRRELRVGCPLPRWIAAAGTPVRMRAQQAGGATATVSAAARWRCQGAAARPPATPDDKFATTSSRRAPRTQQAAAARRYGSWDGAAGRRVSRILPRCARASLGAGGRGRGRGRASRLPWARATRIDFGTHKFCEPLNKEGGWITPPMQMFGHVLGKLRNNRVGCGLTPNEKRDSSQF